MHIRVTPSQRKGNRHMKYLKELKKGDFFKRLIKGTPTQRVYVKDYYDRATRSYWCYPYDDVNGGRFIKATAKVCVEFEF